MKTYKTEVPRITLGMLKGACREQRDLFRREWPEGAEVTIENVRRAQELGLDLAWGERWFTPQALKAYNEATSQSWKAYNAAIWQARKAYLEATAPAWEAYDEATADALKAYNEATAPAWEAYNEALAPARKAYGEAVAPAWEAYDEAIAPAWKAYLETIAPAWVAAYIASVAEREAQPSKAS